MTILGPGPLHVLLSWTILRLSPRDSRSPLTSVQPGWGPELGLTRSGDTAAGQGPPVLSFWAVASGSLCSVGPSLAPRLLGGALTPCPAPTCLPLGSNPAPLPSGTWMQLQAPPGPGLPSAEL